MTGNTTTDYDPDASDTVVTACQGCQQEIVVFQSGEVAERRDEPPESGTIPGSLLDLAFTPHYCPARDGQYECKGCNTRFDNETEADRCCSGPYNEYGYAEVVGADPIEDQPVGTEVKTDARE